jgi:hypothetical protein
MYREKIQMNKHANIVVEGAGEDDALNLFQIALKPGITVGETLGVLGLEGFDLRNGSDRPFAESDDLYALTQDGATLFAALKMDVG